MKNKKKHKYGTGNIVDDFPHYPDNYRDHRTYIYRLTESKIQTHPNKSMEGKKQWSVVQYRNVMPPRIVNLWSFPEKAEAESFMKKNDFVIPSKQN
jgi:hypothetical protein